MGHMAVLGTWREPRAVAPRTILGAAIAASQPAFVSLATGRGTNQVTSLHHRVLKRYALAFVFPVAWILRSVIDGVQDEHQTALYG